MKKVMSMILAVLMTLCLLAGCGKGAADEPAKDGESTQEVNGTASEGDGEIVEVEIWEYFEDLEHEYFTDIMNKWGEENGYRFKIVQYPYGDLNKQYTLGMVSGELPDLTMINNCDTASYVEMGMLQDITDQVETWGETENFY